MPQFLIGIWIANGAARDDGLPNWRNRFNGSGDYVIASAPPPPPPSAEGLRIPYFLPKADFGKIRKAKKWTMDFIIFGMIEH